MHNLEKRGEKYMVVISINGERYRSPMLDLEEALNHRDLLLEEVSVVDLKSISEPDEIWVDLFCDNNYAVSNFGRVYSKPRMSRNYKSKSGFGKKRGKLISTKSKGRPKFDVSSYPSLSLHKAVYFSFNIDMLHLHGDLVIDHIDRNIQNNKLDNLRLVTQKDNCANRGGMFYKER
jgi:hypothetical protein